MIALRDALLGRQSEFTRGGHTNGTAHRGNGTLSVCGLVPYPIETTPSQRFRIEQWRPWLAAQGIVVDLFPFAGAGLMKVLHRPRRWLSKAAELANAFVRSSLRLRLVRRYDVVLVHRCICIAGPAVLERLLRLSGRPVIFDFDDAIHRLHTTSANRLFGWLKFPGKTAAICRLSSHITVGNAYLADYARQFNRNVTVVPTSVDTDTCRPARRMGGSGRVIIGWTGSSTSQTHLEMFAPVLRELLCRRQFELRVLSDREPVLPGIPVSWRPWTPSTEVDEVGQFDIGIMPMPDDQWAKGKCALKALQYMAMGVPAVCSAVGANCEVVRHGENGLLATQPQDWITHLERLIDDSALRQRLGAAGRRTVEQSYSALSCAALFADVVRDVARRES